MDKKKTRILMIANEETHFCNHLLPIALAALKRGYEVYVALDVIDKREFLENLGLKVIFLSMRRKNLNPLMELSFICNLVRILYKYRPDILHNFMMKPLFYGTLLGKIYKIPLVINTYLGLGTLFLSENWYIVFIRRIVICIMKICRGNNQLHITQNQDDRDQLIAMSIADSKNIHAQCSVGVDLNYFKPMSLPEGKIIFVFVGRMLRDKGIYEFIEAAKIIKNKGYFAEFWLVGEPDPGNLTSVTEEEIIKWQNLGVINYFGYQQDILSVWQKAHVAVLPSYREGMSRSLLEAASCNRAVITTNAPGGRDLIIDHENGLLVKPRSAKSLANAIEELILSPEQIKYFADKLYVKIKAEFSDEIIANKIVDFYL